MKSSFIFFCFLYTADKQASLILLENTAAMNKPKHGGSSHTCSICSAPRIRKMNPESFSPAITGAERAVCAPQLSQDAVRPGDGGDIESSAPQWNTPACERPLKWKDWRNDL